MYQTNQLIRFYNPVGHILPPDIKDYKLGLIISKNNSLNKKNPVYKILYQNKTLYVIDKYIKPFNLESR